MGYSPNTNAWMAFMEHGAQAIPEAASIFEIGPGNPSRSLIGKFCRERGHSYFWADLKNRGRKADGFCRMHHDSGIGAGSNRFDVVMSLQVLHHCSRPWRLMPELARVCKPGGVVIVVETMYYTEHRYPVDCGRIWPEGLKALLLDAGLVVEKLVVATSLDGGVGRKHTIGHVDPADLVGIGRKAL